jgi:hypothetical protein
MLHAFQPLRQPGFCKFRHDDDISSDGWYLQRRLSLGSVQPGKAQLYGCWIESSLFLGTKGKGCIVRCELLFSKFLWNELNKVCSPGAKTAGFAKYSKEGVAAGVEGDFPWLVDCSNNGDPLASIFLYPNAYIGLANKSPEKCV